MNQTPQADPPAADDQIARAAPEEVPGSGVPPIAEPVPTPGRNEILVGAAFAGGLILGRLVKRRGK